MKDIHEVLRVKQARFSQLGKQIELLQQAAEKLREVAPLLAENEDDSTILSDAEESSMAARAGAASEPAAPPKPRGVAPRWP